MRKIGIVTLNGYKNYGNRLQNYALQETIKTFGYSVDTVIVDTESFTGSTLDKRSRSYSIKKIGKKILNYSSGKKNVERTKRFIEFSNNHISETDYKISENNLPDQLNLYEKFVVGSDQVWNPYYINGSHLYFLSFVPREKRISYAASFGISSIPINFKETYLKYLTEMKHISVREEQGASIIDEINSRDVQVVLDPTMLLSKNEWKKISKPSLYKPSSPYLLTYFLGDTNKDTKLKIKKIAKEKNLKIVNLASLKDMKYYTADPSEFIDFIDSAEVFCTDSFHGVVFSILFKTPFIVFERQGKSPSMNSRIDTLLTKFKFEARLANNISSVNSVWNIEFSHVEDILTKERELSVNFLKNALLN